ncbi:MAG: carbon-nitrogen hydrolase family protein [Pseudomonadota bacterium]
MSKTMKVAAAHLAPCLLDAEKSGQKAAEWIARAAREHIELLVFPEVFIPGFPHWINCYAPLIQAGVNRAYQDQSVSVDGPEIAHVCNAAAEHNVAVILGISERPKGSRTCFNSVVFIGSDGAVLGVHRKLKPTYAERYIWGEGDGSSLIVTDMPPARVGGLACWEHMMNLARQALIEDGEQIHAALWPSLSTMAGFDAVANIQIEAMMRNHALTGQTFVISASSPVTTEMLAIMHEQLGPQKLMTTGGGWTAIVHPFGGLVAGPITGTDEHLLSAEINLEDISDTKLWADTTGHYARPDVLRLEIDRSARSTLIEKQDQRD